MTDSEANDAEETVSESSGVGRAIEIAALAAQLFFFSMACGVGWFLIRLFLGTLALGTGTHPWIPTAILMANTLLPAIVIVVGWFVYRRWKTQ